MTNPREKKWTPANKAEEHMDAAYRSWTRSKRMDAAVQAVMAGKFNQSEAARRYGVSRPRLNVNVKAASDRIADIQARADQAKAERAAATAPKDGDFPDVVPSSIITEDRRVPSFEEFDRLYFSNLECPDCARHHETPDFHRTMMRALDSPARRLLINCPPYHSKSTLATVKHTIYQTVKDPNHRTLIVSKSQKLAERFLYQIKKYLTDPTVYGDHNLILDWGPFLTGNESNSQSQFYVAGRQGAEKDPTVSALGVGGHIYGIRADTIKFDDIADLENQRNVDRVAEMLVWCTQEAASRVGRNGKLHFVGTRISAGDIYSHLANLPAFETVRFPCILDEEGQTTLWQDHFDFTNAVETRDSMSAEQWQLVYQNVDTPGFGASFPPEVIEANYDAEHALGSFSRNWALVAGLDPAGGGEQAGFTALVLLAVDLETGRRYLVDLVNVKQMKAPQLRDQIFDWAERYPLRELRVESNGLQSQLVQYNQEIQARLTNRGVRVVPHITTKHNKWDAQFGVESMATLFHNRQISLPTKDVASRNRIRPFTEQLQAFPMGQVTDLVMAFWFAELGCREIFQRCAMPLFDPRMNLPPRLAGRRRVIDFGERTVSAPSMEHTHPGGLRDPFGQPLERTERKFVNVGGSIFVP